MFCGEFADAWTKKWPCDDIENYEPCKRIKKAVSYVEGVIVTGDDMIVQAIVKVGMHSGRAHDPRAGCKQKPSMRQGAVNAASCKKVRIT